MGGGGEGGGHGHTHAGRAVFLLPLLAEPQQKWTHATANSHRGAPGGERGTDPTLSNTANACFLLESGSARGSSMARHTLLAAMTARTTRSNQRWVTTSRWRKARVADHQPPAPTRTTSSSSAMPSILGARLPARDRDPVRPCASIPAGWAGCAVRCGLGKGSFDNPVTLHVHVQPRPWPTHPRSGLRACRLRRGMGPGPSWHAIPIRT
jgi:hypothetical protein